MYVYSTDVVHYLHYLYRLHTSVICNLYVPDRYLIGGLTHTEREDLLLTHIRSRERECVQNRLTACSFL